MLGPHGRWSFCSPSVPPRWSSFPDGRASRSTGMSELLTDTPAFTRNVSVDQRGRSRSLRPPCLPPITGTMLAALGLFARGSAGRGARRCWPPCRCRCMLPPLVVAIGARRALSCAGIGDCDSRRAGGHCRATYLLTQPFRRTDRHRRAAGPTFDFNRPSRRRAISAPRRLAGAYQGSSRCRRSAQRGCWRGAGMRFAISLDEFIVSRCSRSAAGNTLVDVRLGQDADQRSTRRSTPSRRSSC